MTNSYATRNFTFGDQSVLKGEDLSKRKPEIPEQQLDDWRGVGLVGAKPDDEKPSSTPAPAKAA